nr:hypothetical protein [Tanacetum cinerariifolium]
MFSPPTVTYTPVYIISKHPKEDLAYYPTDRGDNDDDESSNDDDDDDDVEKDEEDKEEEEHLAPADPSDVSTEAFKTDEFASTPSTIFTTTT